MRTVAAKISLRHRRQLRTRCAVLIMDIVTTFRVSADKRTREEQSSLPAATSPHTRHTLLHLQHTRAERSGEERRGAGGQRVPLPLQQQQQQQQLVEVEVEVEVN
eukprot:gene908-4169_t